MLQEVISLSTGRLEKFGNYDFFKNIQVLTPTKKGPLGTRELNKALQAVLNPNLEELPERKSGDIVYRVGDRVMQIKNNYDITWEREAQPFGSDKINTGTGEKSWSSMYLAKPKEKKEVGTGVFNGEIGTIIEIDEKEKVVKLALPIVV